MFDEGLQIREFGNVLIDAQHEVKPKKKKIRVYFKVGF